MKKYKCKETSCGYSSEDSLKFWRCDYCSKFVCGRCIIDLDTDCCDFCDVTVCTECSKKDYILINFIEVHNSCEKFGGGVQYDIYTKLCSICK